MFVTNQFLVYLQLHGLTRLIMGYTNSAYYNDILNASESYWMNITASPSSDKTVVLHQEHKLWDNSARSTAQIHNIKKIFKRYRVWNCTSEDEIWVKLPITNYGEG